MVDSRSKVKDKKKSLTTSSIDNSQTEMKSGKSQSKEEKHVEFDSKLEISPDSNLKSDTAVSPDLNIVSVENESGERSHPNVEWHRILSYYLNISNWVSRRNINGS